MIESPRERPATAGTVALLLLVSGGCALVFQVVWMRELRLVFGATTAASAAVLAIFMAGLGLGNAVLGPRIDRMARPLRFYGLLEAGVACAAAMSPLMIDAAQFVYIAWGGQSTLGAPLATFVRLLAAALILGVPTFLMGGTLPAAARAISVESDVNRRGLALVYGLNTLGAVVGAGLATFWLLRLMGGRATLWAACGVNLLLAAAVLQMSRSLCFTHAPRAARRRSAAKSRRRVEYEVDESPSSVPRRPGPLGLVCFSAGVIGFAFFLMEIVWYRMLGPLLGGTTYTFGLILCMALLGIGLGGTAYHFAARRLRPSLALFALTCAIEAAVIALPFWYGDGIATWVMHAQSTPATSFAAQVWHWLQVAAVVIFPAALVAGFQFPLLIAVAGSGLDHIGKHVGWTVASNTAGAIVGSIAGGFFLLPLLSAPGAWQLGAALLVGLAMVVALAGDAWRHPRLGMAAAVAAAVALIAVCQPGPSPFWRHSGLGAGRGQVEAVGRNEERELMHVRRRQCLWEAEGIESSVAIMASDSIAFIVNGKADGNAIFDAGTQIGLGLVGPLLHESPKAALVVGLGTGESAGWLADVDSLSSVDVVELEPAVVEMARRCGPVNRNALNNPKLRLHFNDAREFLLTSDEQYDLIVSEPSNPYRAGIASLYTREFYQAVSDRLRERGLLLQWLQGYEVDERTVRIVMNTLRSVFPTMQVWRTRSRDLLFVCGKSPAALKCDLAALRLRMEQPVIAAGLRRAWRAVDAEGLLAHYVCGPRTIEALLAEEILPLNTDDHNLLEFAFADTVGRPTRFSTQDLLQAAIDLDDDCLVSRSSIDAERLLRRRQSMNLFLGGEVPADRRESPPHQERAKALRAYLADRYDEAATILRRGGVDVACPIETVVFAHALAEMGEPAPAEVAAAVAAHSPAEAAAIDVIRCSRRRERPQAAVSLDLALERLRTDPWPTGQVLKSMFRVAGGTVTEPATAATIYEQLAQPLCAYRMENERLMLRYLLAERLGGEYVMQALAPLEPHVPWKGWLLQTRAYVYAEHGHPLADLAQRDLEQFQAWQDD